MQQAINANVWPESKQARCNSSNVKAQVWPSWSACCVRHVALTQTLKVEVAPEVYIC